MKLPGFAPLNVSLWPVIRSLLRLFRSFPS